MPFSKLVSIVINIVLILLNLNGFLYSIGRPKHVRVMAGALEGDMFIGPKAEVSPTLFLTLLSCLNVLKTFHI